MAVNKMYADTAVRLIYSLEQKLEKLKNELKEKGAQKEEISKIELQISFCGDWISWCYQQPQKDPPVYLITGKDLNAIKKFILETNNLLPEDVKLTQKEMAEMAKKEYEEGKEELKEFKKEEESKKKKEKEEKKEELEEKKEEEKSLWSEVIRKKKWARGQRFLTFIAFVSFIVLILPSFPIQFPPTIKAALVIICLDLMSPSFSFFLMIFIVCFQFLIKSSFEGWGGGFITINDILYATEGIPVLNWILAVLINGILVPMMNSISNIGIWLLIYFIFAIIISLLLGLGATMVYAFILAGIKAGILCLLLYWVPLWVASWTVACNAGSVPWNFIKGADPNVCTNLAAIGQPFPLELVLLLIGVDSLFTIFKPAIYKHIEEAPGKIKEIYKKMKGRREKLEEKLEKEK